jgi:hypothetical protein
MITKAKTCSSINTLTGKSAVLYLGALAISCLGWTARAQTGSEPQTTIPQIIPVEKGAYMSEALRSSVHKTVVIAGESPPSDEISGTYEQETAGLIGGMNEGSRLGTVSQEIGGVNVNFPIPILTIPGAIFGGLSGATKREIQEFRDTLTDELANAESKPLTNDGLALDVYREIGKVPGLQAKLFARTTPIPTDTDAVLFVSFHDVGINVEGSDAVLTVGAKATLRRASDGNKLYETIVRYRDRDTLSNWTENDNALWRDYANFAAHYLSREVSAVVFDRVELAHVLRPQKTKTAVPDRKNERQVVSKSPSPTLAWELTLDAENPTFPWAGTIDESGIFYDVEIYTNQRLVYVERQIPEPTHTVAIELEACQTYSWSVRPSYHVDNEVRYGEWMRLKPETEEEAVAGIGISGRSASTAPAYIQDFPLLKIKCGRR